MRFLGLRAFSEVSLAFPASLGRRNRGGEAEKSPRFSGFVFLFDLLVFS